MSHRWPRRDLNKKFKSLPVPGMSCNLSTVFMDLQAPVSRLPTSPILTDEQSPEQPEKGWGRLPCQAAGSRPPGHPPLVPGCNWSPGYNNSPFTGPLHVTHQLFLSLTANTMVWHLKPSSGPSRSPCHLPGFS